MTRKSALSIVVALAAGGWAFPAIAQDAAETAIILSGTGQSQGAASRSLGSSIAGSMNAASAAIQASRNGGQVSDGRRRNPVHQSYAVPASGDMLEGTDAPTYRLGNGASIRVSGTLIQDGETSCVKNCPNKAKP